ncbi:8254_t:CDS:2 [Paraglomus occultum]|uniref:8254_t:CDS:1 n=1 Tax=Paraglomus occultum TaxID=144539 RepID=A0A9N9G5Q9_9GLOM|nr:8254_t:CDS:2 [Paraglomus occultum]
MGMKAWYSKVKGVNGVTVLNVDRGSGKVQSLWRAVVEWEMEDITYRGLYVHCAIEKPRKHCEDCGDYDDDARNFDGHSAA